MAGNETEKQSDMIYAVILGVVFFGGMLFIITLNFWEEMSYLIFKLDYKIAGIINYYYPDKFENYREYNNMVEIAGIPKFNFWKMSFEFGIGNDYIKDINEFYRSLHLIYSFIILFISYLIVNGFKLIPEFRFQNNMRYKLRLVEEAKKRMKIFNKQIKLYNHMSLLLEKKRNPANLGATRQFLNADYYSPFIYEHEIGTSEKGSSGAVETNKKYITDSLFYSQHYVNNYFKYVVDKENNKEKIEQNKTIYSLKKFDEFWPTLEGKIKKRNNLQDLYYYYLLQFFNEKNKDNFILLFLVETKELNDKYLTSFNNFLKRYHSNEYELHKLLNEGSKNNYKHLPYVSYTNESLENFKEMETFILISKTDEKFRLNLEEIFIYFKIKCYSFLLNQSYFFNSKETKVQVPIKNIPPSAIDDISTAEKDEINEIEKVLDELKSYEQKFSSLATLNTYITDYKDFKTQYTNIINTIKSKYSDYFKGLINKEFEFNSIKYRMGNLFNNSETKYSENYFLENLIIEKEETDVILFLKNLKIFIQMNSKIFNLIFEQSNVNKEEIKKSISDGKLFDYSKDISDLKDIYKLLFDRVKILFSEKETMNYFDIKKGYFNLINKELLVFIDKMMSNIELYYKYNLEYDVDNENSILPEIGQPVMPSCYILSTFHYKIEKNSSYFNLIKDFKVRGYKEYILPVFLQIYESWYGNITNLIGYYEKEIDKNKNNLDISDDEKASMELKMTLLKIEAEKQKKSESSIETKLLKIFQVHKFEETIVIALWKEFTKLENLPTTKLSNLKYENFVLWYALTSIGDVDNTEKTKVIGRPFDFNAGLPILIMYELEIYEFKNSIDSKNKTHNLEEG